MGEIYVIGDVQGCYDSLMALLAQLPLEPADALWLCGDLVNRGPKSAEVLRWAMAQGSRVQVVLGNHDLHLLSAAAGARKVKSRDTFQDVLEADDRADLLAWLQSRPLAHHEHDYLMVHAGVHPQWSLEQTLSLADECEVALRDERWKAAWKLSRPTPPIWSSELRGKERLAAALSVLVGVRTLYDDGRLETQFTGAPEDCPAGAKPWFAQGRCETTVVFGHWAALGLLMTSSHIGIDTGCVWGHQLTAVRLSDRQVYQQPAIDERLPTG